jgi:hypothetical protein
MTENQMSGYPIYRDFALAFLRLETRTVRQEGGMALKSATGEEFLKTLENWLDSQTEVLVLIRYSRAAGDKSFEFHTSFAALQERLNRLLAEACVTVFRSPQLQLRGIVDDEFIGKCLSSVPDGPEFVVVETVLTKAGLHSCFNYAAGASHDELREDLEGMRGRPVAVGEYPPWQEDSSEVISGYVPCEDGNVRRGIY